MRAVITRYDGAQQGELSGLMQAYLGKVLSPHKQDYTALIGQAGEQVNGIYEADYRDFNRETYARGRETFDATYGRLQEACCSGIWHRVALKLEAGPAAQPAKALTRTLRHDRPEMMRTEHGETQATDPGATRDYLTASPAGSPRPRPVRHPWDVLGPDCAGGGGGLRLPGCARRR